MTKEELRSYRGIKREAIQIRHLLDELESAMTSPKTSKFDSTPRGGTPNGNALERMTERHEELLSRYNAKLDELIRAQLEIEDAIRALPECERTLIRFKYIQGMTWERICIEMSYEWAQTHRIHARALQMLRGNDDTK